MSYEQEEGGCWCTVVEGIKAEAEATSFIVQLLSELYKATILVAALACGGGCAAGWPALLLPPFELGAFVCTVVYYRSEDTTRRRRTSKPGRKLSPGHDNNKPP